MNFPWVINIAREDAESLARLRLVPGIEVSEAVDLIWLRGAHADEQLETRLAALPARDRYEWLASNQLRPLDRRIPSGHLPDLRWQPLDMWLQAEMPVAALPATETGRISLCLLRTSDEREPELLLTSMEEFGTFAAAAAQVRLDRLQFAADAAGRVLVRGRPLPPLPGRRFVLHGCIAVPAGFSWQPAVHADVLVRAFNVANDSLVLWYENGTITRLHGEQFVPASRSAVRATERFLAEPR